MQATDVSALTITEAARLLESRAVSPLELTDAYLSRIERLNPRINAYVLVTAERARDDARRAEDEIAAGGYRGPLHGIPIGLKDLYDTAGIRTAGGAKILMERVPASDCTVARRLREAGTVLLGKTNTHELAWGATTNNPHFGPTHNPWKQGYVPGGSSGGSGAAIAAGMAAGTLGTDTGGSIRIPAALCGCVGLKPTYGRVSKAGVLPMSWMVDHPGPITHSVEDAAMLLQVIAGYDAADFSSVRCPVDDYRATLRDGIRGLRVGIPRHFFYDDLDPDVERAVDEALEVLRDLGAELRDVDLGVEFNWLADWGLVTTLESQEYHAEHWRTRPDDFGEDLKQILGREQPSALAVMESLRRRYAIAEAARTTLEEVDLLVTPTSPVPAFPIGQNGRIASFTWPVNCMQLPALSLPCGFTGEGLPVGLQLIGRPLDEALVLRAGYAYEQATAWHLRRPPDLA